MPRFRVLVPEVHYSLRVVEAETAEEARREAPNGEELSLEYSHTLDESVDSWETTLEDA